MEAGVKEARASNHRYVNLRIGKIAQTSNEQLEGFYPATTTNKSGTKNHFFAKPYEEIVGYIDEIKWKSHTLPDDTVLTGWDIFINTGSEVFVLHVSSNDRPFDQTMNVLCNVDFSELVKFVGFMGTNKDKSKKQKVLLLSQSDNEKEWVKGKYEAKFLSQLLVKKIKEKIPLTEEDERNIARNPDGTADNTYPYIKEKMDGKWSFEAWREFLMEKMHTDVLPAVEIAKDRRGNFTTDTPQFAGSQSFQVTEDDDDSIPF